MVQVNNEGGPVGSKNEENREQNVMTCVINLQRINNIAYRKIWEKWKSWLVSPLYQSLPYSVRVEEYVEKINSMVLLRLCSYLDWGGVNIILSYFTLLQIKPKINSDQTLILNYISAPYPSLKNTESEDCICDI